MTTADIFLHGVPGAQILERLANAGGNEIGSGKLSNRDSSAALAVNAFGWFINRPSFLPPLPGLQLDGSVETVEVEYCAHFPWTGGRHPWLDAAIVSTTQLIGVESKRFEPFRDAKSVSFASSYRDHAWGNRMQRYDTVREALTSGALRFQHLDAAQLIKHAYGLVTDAGRLGRHPALFYIFAEPRTLKGVAIPEEAHALHRSEVAHFAAAVAGDDVEFASASYGEWLDTWAGDDALLEHGRSLRDAFDL